MYSIVHSSRLEKKTCTKEVVLSDTEMWKSLVKICINQNVNIKDFLLHKLLILELDEYF